MIQHDSYDDDEDDWDAGEEDDAEGDSDEATLPCPYCGQEIYEDAQRCPHCERYISAEDAPAQRKPWWILIGVALCLYAVLSWFL